MTKTLLLDSDVLIDYLRQRPLAVAYLRTLPIVPLLSAIVVAELFSGVRDGQERTQLEAFIRACRVVPVDEQIAMQAGLLRRQYRLSHRPELPDMLIAATALAHNATLVTLNAKHFSMLPDVVVPYQKTQ
ncbi:MAG: type II toxin-antitoxin system VapC family toxin [Cytophagaceae bacterium]|nr:MAG: type II toxin-antitoxin system VapC family toxin [Cytophagaceae bacterium]